MDVSTALTNVNHPAHVSNLPFHLGNRAPILSISACSSDRLVLPMCRGSPRYLHVKDFCFTWKIDVICITSISSHWIAKSSDFCKFVFSPVALPNTSRILRTCLTSEIVGRTNRVVSSAYRLVLNLIGSAPICVALFKMRSRGP